MNSILITLGNSEIQFNENHLGEFSIIEKEPNELTNGIQSIQVRKNIRIGQEFWWVPISSRIEGQIILDNYQVFRPIMKFPLVEPLIEFIRDKKINKVVWIVTNQKNLIHSKGDTIYYAEILQNYFTESLNLDWGIEYCSIVIEENVHDIDWQYKNIGKSLDLIFSSEETENSEIYLFAQGGIDQINHALSLQLIQRYKERVKLMQKAEDSELTELIFPNLFLKDLNKQKIIKHLEDYDFDKAAELILDNQEAKQLAEYCNLRLTLNHHLINQMDWSNEYYFDWDENDVTIQKNTKLKDLVYSFQIDFKQRKFNEGLTKLYTIYENIFKNIIDRILKVDTQVFFESTKREFMDSNDSWHLFLKNNFGEDIIIRLRKKNKNLALNNPNSRTYFYLVRFIVAERKNGTFLFDEMDIIKIDQILNDLRDIRNQINHSLGSVSEYDILDVLVKKKSTLEEFTSILNKFTSTNGLGIFESIKAKLLKYYS